MRSTPVAALTATLAFGATLWATLWAMAPAAAGPAGPEQARAVAEIPIRNHRGGYLPRIVAEMERLNRAGIAARIDGEFCFSACTVFLALDRVCVAPWTQFGFHAPVDPRTGQALRGAAFDRATLHVARYYRPPLADWWLREGRHVRRGLVMRSGAELIAMGYRACTPAIAAG